MSRFARDGENANSALLVGVGPEDFGGDDPLAGVELQRAHGARGLRGGRGGRRRAVSRRPRRRWATSWPAARAGRALRCAPPTRAAWPGATCGTCLPRVSSADALAARAAAARSRSCAGSPTTGAVMTGVETRSSSPVRIVRERGAAAASDVGRDGGRAALTGPSSGLYPCGEGAGYAGGIMSAACDGLRVAQAVTGDRRPRRTRCRAARARRLDSSVLPRASRSRDRLRP